ncbi:M48 family metallopeptidase [Patescibacteria group bacterium]|nr:M48 family metallopeptidase [Patescibacteria group bacterium]
MKMKTNHQSTSPLLLKKHQLVWIINGLKKNRFKKIRRVKKTCRSSSKDYKEKKEIARKLVKEKVERFNSFYAFKFGRISIRNQRTRWGSCSSKKNLNFNYRIIYLPERLADYIIIHELCHLKELNHTKKFWALVSKTFPDYKSINKELRTNGFKCL